MISLSIPLRNGAKVQVDGYDESAKVTCEIYCRVGPLKPAQKDKIASDILKFLLIERLSTGKWRKILCFVDTQAANSVRNASWLASTCEVFDIEVKVIEIPEELKNSLLLAQKRQQNAEAKVIPSV